MEVVEGVTLDRPSVKLRDPLGSFSPGIGPPKRNIVILFLFFRCEFVAPPKKWWTKADEFSVFDGG